MAERKWYVLYTRHRREIKIAELLSKKKMTTYLPLYEFETLVDGRKKIIYGPLFPGFVFVLMDTDKKEYVLRQSRDIINFMHWLDKPVEIMAEEINSMKKFMNEYSCTRLEKTPVVPGERSRFNDELLLIRKGNRMEVNVATVKLTLPSLGQVMVAEIRKEKTEEFAHATDLMIGKIVHS